MLTYVEAIHGPWDDDLQFVLHQEWLRYSDPEVVDAGGEPVGVVDWAWRDHDLCVGRIEIQPDRQGAGLGSSVLAQLAGLAAGRSQPVVLEVIDINPARHWYERLGFRPFDVVDRKIHLRLDPTEPGRAGRPASPPGC